VTVAKEVSMAFLGSLGAVALAVGLIGLPATASAQAAVSATDIQRLQDQVYEASREIASLRDQNRSLATELDAELDGAREETIYLKVKLRKNEPVARTEYSQLRDRIDRIRSRARGDDSAGAAREQAGTPAATASRRSEDAGLNARGQTSVPAGTDLDVRLRQALSSETAQVEDRVYATTLVDLKVAERVLVPAGSELRGIVSSVHKATRLERTGSITISFDRITIGGRTYPIAATVTDALESEGIRGEAARIGAGAGVGAIIGGIIGGVKGALAGILIGGGGTIAATPGKDVELPAGTVLRVRLDSDLNLQ
jgi:hypothetical protein